MNLSLTPSQSKRAKAPKSTAVPGAVGALENLFTHPDYFGVPARPVQRAKCRLIEGLPLGEELENDPDVVKMMGGDAKARPPVGKRPFEMLDVSAIRIGKSLFAAAFIIWLSQTVDLSGTIPSDIVNIFVVALKIDGCRAVMKHVVQTMLDKPALSRYLADDPKEVDLASAVKNGLRIKHPSGKIIEVKCVPLDRGGGSGLSVYCAGVVVDEYPRMIGASDGVRNVEHFREGVLGRLLPRAVFLATGSPWQPYGPAYDLVQKHFGQQTEEVINGDIFVLRTSAESFVGFAPEWTTLKRDRLKRKSPTAYKTDFLAEFADGEEAVFPAVAVEDAWKKPLTDAEYGQPAIFADPSALRHDYWAAMVGGWVYPVSQLEDIYEHVEIGESPTTAIPGRIVMGRRGWIVLKEDVYGRPIPRRDNHQPKPWFEIFEIVSWDKNSGARGGDLVKAIGDMGRRYGCRDFHWDGYEQLMLADMVRRENLRPVVHSWSGAGRKTEAVDHLRTLFVERRVRLPEHAILKNELLRFRSRPTPGGNFQYVVAGGAGHGDHASCLTLAMRADLDGFVDRSPTKTSATKHEVYDHEDPDID